MKMNNVYFLTFDDTYHKFEILKCGNALFTKYYPPHLLMSFTYFSLIGIDSYTK